MEQHIGFSGPRTGMTVKQRQSLYALLKLWLFPTMLHHGDCFGADQQADAIAREMRLGIAIHPPTDDSRQARCVQPGDTIYDPLPYLERNHAIVDRSHILIAAPKTAEAVRRSGTWATVRYALAKGCPVLVIDPDGWISLADGEPRKP